MRVNRETVINLCGFVGLGLIGTGLWMLSAAAACIGVGSIVFACGVFGALRKC